MTLITSLISITNFDECNAIYQLAMPRARIKEIHNQPRK